MLRLALLIAYGLVATTAAALGRGPSTGLGRIFDPPPAQDVEGELRQAYADDSSERGLQVEADRPFIEWAADVPTPKRALDLVRFAFQRELYSRMGEFARSITVEKAAQIGISEWLIRWVFRRTDLGATSLYVMPKEKHAVEFGKMRMAPVLQASAYLRHRQDTAESPTNTTRLKTIGLGFLALRGSESEDELTSVDADALALDEYNRLNQANLPRVLQRITGPMSHGLVRNVSTPTIPNFGISKEVAKTDQRRWFVKCSRGHWTPMLGAETFHEVLDHGEALLRCPKCRNVLDVRQGKYRPTVKGAELPIGYRLPKFVVPGIDLRGIIDRAEVTSVQGRKAHHNEDLGEGWQPANAGLTDEQIAAAVRAYGMSGAGYIGFNPVTMGVDIAASRALNLRISEHLDEHTKRAIWIGLVDDGLAPWGEMANTSAFEILSLVMERFKVRMAVVDYMPDPRLVRAWCERHYGRAYRVQWHDKLSAVLNRKDPKGDPTKLNARYLEGIDSTLDLIRQQKNLLPDERPDDYDDHLKARVLDTLEDDEGNIRQAWVKTGPDDFLQAEAYDVIATHMLYVHEAAGQIGGTSGQVVAARPDVVQEAQEWRQPASDLDYSEGPDDEPVSGW